MTKERIEEIADEVGYDFKSNWESEACWLDYCDSVLSDPTVTEDQIRAELLEFKRIEEAEE